MEKIRNAFGKFVSGLNYIGLAACFVMVFVVAIDVILRKVSGAQLSCARETEGGLFLRLYNPTKAESLACVTLSAPYAPLILTDGLGQPLPEAAPMAGPEISLTLGAYKVQGVLLR